MSVDGLSDNVIRDILTRTRRIALVGASANPDRPSNEVMGFLLRRGYEVTPINPGLVGQAIHGQQVVGALDQAGPLEMVDVFRNSAHVAPVMQDAIRLGARVVWMQLGVIDEASAEAGRAAGLVVVMDRCPVIETARLGVR